MSNTKCTMRYNSIIKFNNHIFIYVHYQVRSNQLFFFAKYLFCWEIFLACILQNRTSIKISVLFTLKKLGPGNSVLRGKNILCFKRFFVKNMVIFGLSFLVNKE